MKISSLGKLMLGSAAMALGRLGFRQRHPERCTDSLGRPGQGRLGRLRRVLRHRPPRLQGRQGRRPLRRPPRPRRPPLPPRPPRPPRRPRPRVPAPASVRQAVVIQADALFDFDKSVLRPDGRKSIDDALAKLRGVDLEMVIATGHTDSVGTDAYNQKPVRAPRRRGEGLPGEQGHPGLEDHHHRQGRVPARRDQQDRRRPPEEPSRGHRVQGRPPVSFTSPAENPAPAGFFVRIAMQPIDTLIHRRARDAGRAGRARAARPRGGDRRAGASWRSCRPSEARARASRRATSCASTTTR